MDRQGRKREIIAVTPDGVLWLIRGEHDVYLRIRGRSNTDLWRKLQRATSAVIAPTTLSKEDGSSYQVLIGPVGGHPFWIEPKDSDWSVLGQALEESGISDLSRIWVRWSRQEGKSTAVCLPTQVDAAGWQNVGSTGTTSSIKPTRRLPVHRRPRARLGAIVLVSLMAAAISLTCWVGRAREQDRQVAQFCQRSSLELSARELLDRRALALVHGEREVLEQVEDEHLVQADLDSRHWGRVVVAAPYGVELTSIDHCDGSSATFRATVATLPFQDCSGITCLSRSGSVPRGVRLTISRVPERILSFETVSGREKAEES